MVYIVPWKPWKKEWKCRRQWQKGIAPRMESCSSASKCGSGMRVSLLDYVRESQVWELLSYVSNGRNNSQRCWMLHVASHCTPCCVLLDVAACCWELLHPFHTTAKTDAAIPLPTLFTQQCWELLLCPFARSFTDQLRQNFPQRRGVHLDERFLLLLFCFPFCLFVFYLIFVFVFLFFFFSAFAVL